MPKNPLEEKRRHKRISLIQEIECEGDAGKFRKRLSDISFGGMFIDSLTVFPPGSVIKLNFRLAGSEIPIQVSGKVLYVQDKIGSGIQFLDLKPDDGQRIGRLVEKVLRRRQSGFADPGTTARVPVHIPVTLMGTDQSGTGFEDKAAIVALGKNGARIRTDRTLDLEMTVFLLIPNGSKFEGKVVWIGDPADDTSGEIGIRCRSLAHSLGFNFP